MFLQFLIVSADLKTNPHPMRCHVSSTSLPGNCFLWSVY